MRDRFPILLSLEINKDFILNIAAAFCSQEKEHLCSVNNVWISTVRFFLT
jgi:hypothetical protein